MKFTIFAVLLTFIGCQKEAAEFEPKPLPVIVVAEEPPPQPAPKAEPEFSAKEIEVINSISSGMIRIKEKKDNGQWYVCGKRLDRAAQLRTSLSIAEAVVTNMKSLAVDFDPWGVVGTMFNESRFDPCALGKYPRAAATEFGLIKPKRRGNSYKRETVLRAIVDPRMKKRFKASGYDLGPCQILTRFYPGEAANMMTVNAGIRICVLEMQSRAKNNKTKTPWLYWRGSKTPWYFAKIRRWVKVMKKR
jgi:hypothetical protein